MGNAYGFISTGSGSSMYTLRVMSTCFDSEGRPFDIAEYFCNLSTDWEKAVKKARAKCAISGIPLIAKDSFYLNEIIRLGYGERAAAEAEAAEIAAKEKAEAEAAEAAEIAKLIAANLFIGGKYAGLSPADEDLDYVRYMASLHEDSKLVTKANINAKIAKNWLLENEVPESAWLPYNVGSSVELELVLKKVITVDGLYGISYLYITEANGKDKITFFTTAKGFKELEYGDRFKIKGIIKGFDERNNIKGTTLAKPKLIK
jgi:hypothetical protein